MDYIPPPSFYLNKESFIMPYEPPYLGIKPKLKPKASAGAFKFKKSKGANDSVNRYREDSNGNSGFGATTAPKKRNPIPDGARRPFRTDGQYVPKGLPAVGGSGRDKLIAEFLKRNKGSMVSYKPTLKKRTRKTGK